MSKKVIALLFAVGLIAAGAIAIDGDAVDISLTEEDSLANVQIDPGHVRIYKNGELVAEQNNVLMRGHEAIAEQIASGDSYAWNHITLGSGDEPAEGDFSLDSEYEGDGLEPAEADITMTDPHGDETNAGWELVNTFTYTGDDPTIVNTTAQYSPDDPEDYNYFAGTAFDRDIELHTDDELTVEWINEVQEAS